MLRRSIQSICLEPPEAYNSCLSLCCPLRCSSGEAFPAHESIPSREQVGGATLQHLVSRQHVWISSHRCESGVCLTLDPEADTSGRTATVGLSRLVSDVQARQLHGSFVESERFFKNVFIF